MTKDIHILTSKAIGVVVPEDSLQYSIAKDNEGVNRLWYSLPIVRGMFQIELPEGEYSILGKGDDLKEEDWKKVVESEELFTGSGVHFFDRSHYKRKYVDYLKHKLPTLETAKESGLSLLKSLSLNPENTLIILKH